MAIAEIFSTVTEIEAQQPSGYSAEALQILDQIRDELNRLGTTVLQE